MANREIAWHNVGLPPATGEVLDYLISHPESTQAQVATATGITRDRVTRVLQQLAQELLVVRVGQSPVRWSASPPRLAIEAMLARRRTRLAELEVYSEQLHKAYNSTADHRFAVDQFEVLDTPQRVSARYTHLLGTARVEVLHLAMPPYVAAAPGDSPVGLETQEVVIRQGVRFRSVYDADTFDDFLSLETAQAGDHMGGEIRLFSGLPMKLVMFDARAAIIPVSTSDPVAGSLLVYSPTLLQVLAALFEDLWEQAVPWASDAVTSTRTTASSQYPPPDPRIMQMLQLLSLGMTDEAIARAIGVSRRTIQQWVSDTCTRLGAKTRFQIALRAQRRGWLP
ncbi:MAG: helix-turn-helix transcriptional regulator [Nocardioidaceae bacterium]